ncbi:MAG: protein kinase domain-containing protein [Gemmataceae bacterium]
MATHEALEAEIDRNASDDALTEGVSLSQEARHAPTALIHPISPPVPPADKSVLIDLAYEEYCEQCEAGTPPDPDAFCERYPGLQNSLHRLLEAHQFLQENSQLLAEETAPAWPAPGDTFLGFELIRELGRGAFARVFLANEPALGSRRVVVKVALRGAAEAETLGRLRHPHIVPVHSVHQDPRTGLTAVCMPYLGSATLTRLLDCVAVSEKVPASGSILADIIRTAGFDCDLPAESFSPLAKMASKNYVEAVAEIGAQVATALAFVHARGIYHRDLKPSNVLLGADGQPRLLDFNLSFDEETAQQRLGGTLPYMAPEQLKACEGGRSANPCLVGAPADIFSLGVILYELLTGRHPFGPIPLKLPTHAVRSLLLERQQSGPRSLRKLNPRVGVSLSQIIEQCLAFDAAHRPASAAKVASALRHSQTFAGMLYPWVRSHIKAVAASIVLSAGTIIAASFNLPAAEPLSVKKFNQGVEEFKRQDYLAAIRDLDQALQADPQLKQAWFIRGRVRLKMGDAQSMKEAVNDFQQAYRLDPDADSARCLVYCYGWLGNLDQAITWFTAIDEDSIVATDHNNLGCCLVQRNTKGDLPAAIGHFQKASRTAPGFLTAANNYAIAEFRLAKSEKRLKMPPKPLKLALDLVDPLSEGP